MAKKKKPGYGVAEVVRSEIITFPTIDFSSAIKDPENWTHGPARPVAAIAPARKRRGQGKGKGRKDADSK